MATGSTTSAHVKARTAKDGAPPAAIPVQRAAEPPPPVQTSRTWRRWLPHYRWSGTLGALPAGYSSFTPSLLPRGWLLQGLIAGVTAAIGYGIAVFVAWFVLTALDRQPGPALRRRAWQVLALLGPVIGLVMLGLGRGWQADTHRLMGLDAPPAYNGVWIVVVAVGTFALFVGIGRGIRGLTRWVVRLLGRLVPERLARPIGVVAVTTLLVVVLNGVLFQGLVNAVNEAFSLQDGRTEAGAVRPTVPERSGSDESLVSWDSLGLQGRNFVGTGPTPGELDDFSGRPALQPIRIYAGLESAAEIDDRAALAVQDLQRAGGFEREVLVVITTTGTGWVDPAAGEALEYEMNGDSAMVAMQYSYLPSWMSFLVDQAKARDAGRALFDAVYGVWTDLPSASRPKLLIFGESLGTFGGEAAFSGLADIQNRTDGVLWAGPPNFNDLWRGLVADRDDESPEWLPVYEEGRTVRFADQTADLAELPGPWDDPRLVYLQNASDPIVWWSPRLITNRPGWLDGERAPDVSRDMPWIPLVTFWQVSADMAFATGVPDGHGHRYGADYVEGWAAVAQPEGWTEADSERLRELLG
jgi:uncharacterized membrane protein